MGTFVWTAKDKNGRPVVREISAADSNEAKAMLVAEGCTDLKFVQDEIGTIASESIGKNRKFLGQEINVSAEQRVKHMGKPPATFLRVLWDGMGQSKALVLILAGAGGFECYRGHIGLAIVCFVLLLAWMIFILWVGLTSVYFRRLVSADEWHRWDEVFELVEKLEDLGKYHFNNIPASALGRHYSKALAGTGRLDEALQNFQRFENQPDCPSWMHKAFMASISDAAKEHDKALEFNLAAIAEKPSPILYLDLANRYARYKKDPVRARIALAEAEKSELPEMTKSSPWRSLGIILYLEGDYEAARKALETSVQMMEATRNVPYRTGRIAVAKGHLCCVLSKLGDKKGANQAYRDAEKYLVATDERDLLAECRGLLGL